MSSAELLLLLLLLLALVSALVLPQPALIT
jgi:hypothetical protein